MLKSINRIKIMKKIFLVIFLSTTLVLSQGFENCSVVSLISGDTVVWGRNHDEKQSNCLIVYNPAGLYKQGFELENEKKSGVDFKICKPYL